MSIITKQLAQAVVHEIGEEVDYHLNLMDDKGIIIASTDEARIGVQHDGALKILKEQLDEVPIDETQANERTRVGTNLAIHYENKIVGVIGITGPRSEVQKYGRIVRRMTEVLLEESIRQNAGKFNRRIIYRFVDDWLRTEQIQAQSSLFRNAQALHINVRIPRRCIVFSYQNHEELSRSMEGQHLMGLMDEVVRKSIESIPDSIYYHIASQQYCFLPAANDKAILTFIERVQSQIDTMFQHPLFAAFDGMEEGTILIRDVYDEAQQALNSCREGRTIVGFSELSLELLTNFITKEQAEVYLKKLFRTNLLDDVKEWIDLINLYFQHEGSITKMSDATFFHKNTLQYKLKKLAELTGYDIRIPSGSVYYFLAKDLFQQFYE